jgi:ABC-type amino acid transport substrate-binding protein
MITKEAYIQGEIEASLTDLDFVYDLISQHYENQVKDLTEKEFKEYLENLGFEIDEEVAA